ncbi:MAG: RluA family pseudouridine synthase, partial [Vicinamibacterales bacterium]
ELVTGRTHQIRVHLAAMGWPVLGDRVYGERHPALSRQALHAWRVTLPHPITRKPLEIEAAVPPDLQQWIPQNFRL